MTDAPITREGRTRAIHVSFVQPVTLTQDHMRLLDSIIGEICDDYERAHPGRTCWPAGFGDRIVSMPMTAQDDADGVPIVFDETTYAIDCAEREDYDWPCAKCEHKQGDHGHCIIDPPAGDCAFEPKAAPPSPPKPRGLVPMHVYLSAVNGRSEMRKALKETRTALQSAEAKIERLRTALKIIANGEGGLAPIRDAAGGVVDALPERLSARELSAIARTALKTADAPGGKGEG